MNKGVRMIAETLLGKGEVSVHIGGKNYTIPPPTIERIAGAGYYLADFKECETLMDMVTSMESMDNVCKAVSWFIQGDEELYRTLSKGTIAEVIDALAKALGLIGIENFLKLSALVRNVQSLIAVTR